MRGPFAPGERVLLIDQRERTYLLQLKTNGTYHTHSGTLPHEALLGRPEGIKVETSGGMTLVAFRPTFADFVLKMPRGAQVVYPKDVGPILTYVDVFPGAQVLEAGTGSGALTIALCRAVGGQGRVVSYELREEHRERALANIQDFFGALPAQLDARAGDVRAVSGERFDRAVLDLPEPWAVLESLRDSLEPGGVLGCYLPTTIQVHELVMSLPGQGFMHIDTFEVLRRSWHVAERSVRPDHRMVGHTGFVTIARRSA